MSDRKGGRTALAVLSMCFLMNMLGRGFSETFAVFLLPLEEAFDWSRSRLTGVYSVFMVAHGVSAPLIGIAFDRYGPRVTYGLGLASLGGGYVLASRLEAPWELYIHAGLLTGIGVAALSMVTASGLVARWWTHRLGTAMGIAYAGYGFGVIAVVPLTAQLIAHVGWRASYHVLGLTLLVLLPLVLAAPFGRWMRGHVDYRGVFGRETASPRWTIGRALADSGFWGLFAVFFFTASAIYSVSVQAVAYLVSVGFSPLAAATAFGFTGVLSTCGMASAGWLSDRIGRGRTVALSFALTIIGTLMLMLLATRPSAWLLALGIFCFGLSAGSRGPVVSALIAQLFAGGGLGAIYGAVTLGMGLGAAAGSWISGALFDLTGGYSAMFVYSVLCAVAALSQFWIVPALRSGRRNEYIDPPWVPDKRRR